jgi:hypothetical protein
MEYIDGYSLAQKWNTLNEEEQIKACTKIGKQLQLFRSILFPHQATMAEFTVNRFDERIENAPNPHRVNLL